MKSSAILYPSHDVVLKALNFEVEKAQNPQYYPMGGVEYMQRSCKEKEPIERVVSKQS